jgi:hypothetical protein
MTGDTIKLMIDQFLIKLANNEITIPEDLASEGANEIFNAFQKPDRSGFAFSPSMLGRPLCQIQMAKKETPQRPVREDAMATTFATGDMLEAWVVMILKAAGVPVEATKIPTTLKLAGKDIKGEADIIIDGKVYDIKTASAYSFKKYTLEGGFGVVKEDDPFGYVTQGFLYSAALDLPFGGWVVANKNTGEICICDVPSEQSDYQDEAIQIAEGAINSIEDEVPFERCFQAEEETFRKAPSGNMKLCFNCEWCSYKHDCWEDLDYRPNVMSSAMSPKWVYYTELTNIPERE